jgi:hypothetical protein
MRNALQGRMKERRSKLTAVARPKAASQQYASQEGTA